MRAMGISICVAICLAAFSGCQYKVAFDQEQAVEIDASLLGIWKYVPKDDDGDEVTMLIYEGNDREYTIAYLEDKDAMVFRGYLVDVKGVKILNMQWLNRPKNDEPEYIFYRYTIKDSKLYVQPMNTDVIATEIDSQEDFIKRVIENIKNQLLFNAPENEHEHFVRIKSFEDI